MAKTDTNYPITSLAKKGVVGHLAVTATVLILMMAFGIIMLFNQGGLITISPDLFYSIMTVHGIGMIGMASLGGAAIMWYFLSKYVPLNPKVLMVNLVLSVIGIAMILIAAFVFKFSDAWTFLYPLPSISAKQHGMAGAMFFLNGVLLIGVGFLIMYLEIGRKIAKQYGGLMNGLGWDMIFGKTDKHYGPPAAVVASTMVVICNSTAILAGATVIVMSIVNILNPSIVFDALLAKHLTYAFGHIFANATIYMAVVGVYEILAKYADRPWKANKVFLIAWNFSTLFTLMIYTHHLLMDFAVPKWMLLIGQIFSYANGLPVMVVTAYGALMIVYRSGLRWDMASGLMFLAMFGWVAGAVPAIIDATIVVNHVMHNTKWVPGHFHTYMGLGVTIMIIAFMYYYNKAEGNRRDHSWDRISAAFYTVFFLGLTGSFLYAGKISAPRRWAVHLPEWMLSDIVGGISACFILAATISFTLRFFANVKYTKTANTSEEMIQETTNLMKKTS